MTGLKAQLNRRLYECGRDPLSLFLLGCVVAAALTTFLVLSFLLGYILWQGLPNIEASLFALHYNSENVSLFPALVDTVLMVLLALAIATPLGIFAAVYLVEYASRGNKLVGVVRVTADTLAGIPSIVYGLFGMLFFVTYLKWGYSLLAGACTVAIMILPLIMRTTEEALKAIPDSYREGSYGLGAGKLRTVFAVVLPSAVPGILAGVILAIGRIVGESAALLFTSGVGTNIRHGGGAARWSAVIGPNSGGAYVCAGQRGPVYEAGLCDSRHSGCDRYCDQCFIEPAGQTIDEGKIIWTQK